MDERALASALAYANEHQERFLDSFQELLRFPSISTDPAHQDDLEACGDWILAEMERIGFQQCRKMRTDGHPVLYGEWLQAGPAAPTAIIYAHYDVQPVDPLALWESPPFEPTGRDQRLYARGVVDNKCGVWGNLKVFESLIESMGELPLNIKLCFEGEKRVVRRIWRPSSPPTRMCSLPTCWSIPMANSTAINRGRVTPPVALSPRKSLCIARALICIPANMGA